MRILSLLILVLTYLLVVACTRSSEKNDRTKTEIYFGLSNKYGSVSDSAWNRFRKSIDTTFRGYSEVRASGYWTDSTGKSVNEQTSIIIYIHEPTISESIKIDSLIRRYKRLFDQESVLKTEQKVKAYF